MARPQPKPATSRLRTVRAGEFKISAVRQFDIAFKVCDTPQALADYWQAHITSHPYYNPDVECLVVVLLNSRRYVLGHHLVSTGTLDTILVHAREVFRAAIIASASAIAVMHNHPSGDPHPSEADIKVTRDLIRAGQLLKLELLDHVVMGRPTPNQTKPYASLRELGYFWNISP